MQGHRALLDRKLRVLCRGVRATRGLVVAFSGGVDSTLLAAVARRELGDRALAFTAASPTYPRREQEQAAALAAALGIRHVVVESDELRIPGFCDNPRNRCYYCKSELFRIARELADRHGLPCVADGTNADDAADVRPGRLAAAERGVLSPLLEAGLTKADIRALSRRLGLPTADKPALACLASRVPYGTRITRGKLEAIDRVESLLREQGFRQVRVRHHGAVARIEVEPADIPRLCRPRMRARVTAAAKAAGFTYVAVDIEGYRTGSMNEPRP